MPERRAELERCKRCFPALQTGLCFFAKRSSASSAGSGPPRFDVLTAVAKELHHFRLLGKFEQALVALGILDNQCCPAVDGEHHGMSGFLHLHHEFRGFSFEIAE